MVLPRRAALLLAVAVAIIAVAESAAGNARAGGAGYARYFDSFKGTTISLKWDDRSPGNPLTQLTISYWMNIMDPYLTQNVFFAYSAYSVTGRQGAGGEAYENANEAVVMHAPTYTRMMRATSRLEIDSTAVYAANSTWQHNTIVWSANGSGTQGGRVHESLAGTRALDSPARLFDFSFSSVKTM